MDFQRHLLSRPVEVHWAGFRSDTFRLQQQGWSISAQQDVQHGSMQIALKNERLGMIGLSERIDWDYLEIASQPMRPLPGISIQLMSRKVEVFHMMDQPLASFQTVDAMPQFINRKVSNLEDLVHFAPSHARTQQLIVPEASVDDLMSRILDMQQGPRIERMREEVSEERLNAGGPRQKFHAQIISLAA